LIHFYKRLSHGMGHLYSLPWEEQVANP